MTRQASPISLAHSPNSAGVPHRLRDHLACVRDLAGRFAEAVGLTHDARLAGLLHDLGKYGELFQARLRGEAKGIDHWSAGAWIAARQLKAPAAALAIHGHHIGLQQYDETTLKALDPQCLAREHKLGLALSDPDPEKLFALLKADGLVPDTDAKPELRQRHPTAGAMLDVRLLFSCLVDADFLDTEAHFEGDAQGKRYRAAGPPLEPVRALDVLTRHVEGLAAKTQASPAVRALRGDLWNACLSAADRDPRLWTLSAPTGSGKTLAMVGFALRHAIAHGLRRVVIVIPYLSIIEQTARELRKVFEPAFGREYVLEHHSLTETGREQAQGDAFDEHVRRARLLAENWDAPIVVTTSVQALESLFSNRPSACRKLHRLAEAVLLFDEVQTLPLNLIVATLGTLARLAARRRTTVVFATATQPAFTSLDPHVRALEGTRDKPVWVPEEIVPASLELFARARRVRPQWPQPGERRSWDTVARELRAAPQVLCIVNTKRHARDLTRALTDDGDALFHISTQMCPAHRQTVLARVRERLSAGQPCRLISTQCVEAGVDVDFPLVYRALAPLEAVAQAAGRCNREGRAEHGTLVVFEPEDGGWPNKTYEQAAQVTRTLIERRGPAGMDLDDPALFDEYYRRFFAFLAPGQADRELREAIQAQDFPKVAQLYRLIAEDRINVLVPYHKERFEALRAEIEAGETPRDWRRRAQVHAVSVYRPREDHPIWTVLEPVPLARGRHSQDDDWWVLRERQHYDRKLLGLLPPDAPAVWLV